MVQREGQQPYALSPREVPFTFHVLRLPVAETRG